MCFVISDKLRKGEYSLLDICLSRHSGQTSFIFRRFDLRRGEELGCQIESGCQSDSFRPFPSLRHDSHTFNQVVPGSSPGRLISSTSQSQEWLPEFLNSRRQDTSPRTTEFYEFCLKPFISNYELTPSGINSFLANLNCANGRNAYYRAIRAFCNWLYRQGYIEDNPITKVDATKMMKVLLSLSPEQVDFLIDAAETVRDKAIVSLFADSGIRLNELLTIRLSDVDWECHTVTVWGKGGKQRRAPFTNRTSDLLTEMLEIK